MGLLVRKSGDCFTGQAARTWIIDLIGAIRAFAAGVGPRARLRSAGGGLTRTRECRAGGRSAVASVPPGGECWKMTNMCRGRRHDAADPGDRAAGAQCPAQGQLARAERSSMLRSGTREDHAWPPSPTRKSVSPDARRAVIRFLGGPLPLLTRRRSLPWTVVCACSTMTCPRSYAPRTAPVEDKERRAPQA